MRQGLLQLYYRIILCFPLILIALFSGVALLCLSSRNSALFIGALWLVFLRISVAKTSLPLSFRRFYIFSIILLSLIWLACLTLLRESYYWLFEVSAAIMLALIAESSTRWFGKYAMQAVLVQYVNALQVLISTVFACIQDVHYPNFRYLFERRLLMAKHSALYASHVATSLIETNPRCSAFLHQLGLLKELQSFYQELLIFAHLRHRVTDHATFRFAAREWRWLLEAFRARLDEMVEMRRDSSSAREEALSSAIASYQSIDEQVQQVAAKNPLVFQFAMLNIKRLARALDGAHVDKC